MKLNPDTFSVTLRKLNPELFKASPLPQAPTERESELHEQIFAECRRRGWIAFHGSMAARTHRTEGEPDFVILADGGKLFLVECKSRTGKLSEAQVAMRFHADTLGHTIHVVRSFAEFFDVVCL